MGFKLGVGEYEVLASKVIGWGLVENRLGVGRKNSLRINWTS